MSLCVCACWLIGLFALCLQVVHPALHSEDPLCDNIFRLSFSQLPRLYTQCQSSLLELYQ